MARGRSLTWRPQLGVAGRAGQRQALAKPVHAVEADGDVGLRHGLQVVGGGEGHPVGLVSESRLWRAEPGHAWRASLPGKGEKKYSLVPSGLNTPHRQTGGKTDGRTDKSSSTRSEDLSGSDLQLLLDSRPHRIPRAPPPLSDTPACHLGANGIDFLARSTPECDVSSSLGKLFV